MRSFGFPVVLATFALIAGETKAQTSTLTQAGYTGFEITPSARLIEWGRAEFVYDNQLPGALNSSGRNYVLGFGLLPHVEIAARLATNTLTCNLFAHPECGIRDLSASGKIGFGLDAANRFRIAAGATDVGGAATNFRSYYGVLTYSAGMYEVSGGLAKRSQSAGARSKSPLNGPFAAAAWQPASWIRAHVEYTDRNAWAGLRLFAPAAWVPDGWSVYIGANRRLNSNPYTERSWISAGVSIPLYSVPKLAPRSNAADEQSHAATAAAPIQSAPPASAAAREATVAVARSTTASDEQLQAVAEALGRTGLDSTWVGRLADGTVIARADNGSYRWNSVDGLGAALGAVERALAGTDVRYDFILTQHDVPVVAATGRTECLRLWIEGKDPACVPVQFSTPGTADLDQMQRGASWVVRNSHAGWQTVRVAVSPVLRGHIGTELGALNYSLGANVGLQLPLWAGGRVEWRRDVPLARTSEFQASGGFGGERVRSETERFALVQTAQLKFPSRGETNGNGSGSSVTVQGTVGRVGSTFDGVHGAARWEPGAGLHRLSAEAGYFHNSRRDPTSPAAGVRNAKPLLLHYRYSFTPTRSYIEASAGQFMYNDRGFQIGLRQWFNDVSVRAYYRRTQFGTGQAAHQFVGLELSLPIGPRHDARPIPHLQIGGAQRFSYAEETMIREPINAVRPGFGILPPTPSLDETFNSDRAGLAYFESNLRRLREAAQ